uniref:Deltameth_res domain-containing protein n=1 Tax=Globodera pallida TaxID=36090 RepID=A0A183BHH7_GLOPA
MPCLVGRTLPLGWSVLYATSWRSTSELLQCRTANLLWQTKRGLCGDLYNKVNAQNQKTPFSRPNDWTPKYQKDAREKEALERHLRAAPRGRFTLPKTDKTFISDDLYEELCAPAKNRAKVIFVAAVGTIVLCALIDLDYNKKKS